MKKDLVKKMYLKKIKEYVFYNKKYFNENISKITDAEFDQLKNDIIKLESQHNFLNHKNSPSQSVGFQPLKIFKKKTHKVPMLSLANAFTEEDLINFEKRIFNFLSEKKKFDIEYSVEPKIDGISASLIYLNGVFVTGLSRGDGKQGEDITANLKTIKDIPKSISANDFPEEIDIRGEVFIKNSDFKKINEKFANPRNAASGSLRQKNPNDTSKIPLKFIAYTFGYEKGMKIKKQSEYLDKLKNWGFSINPLNRILTGTKKLMENYHEIESRRSKIDFDIDGIVYKINDFKMQKRLGNVANAPRWAIAHKFSANSGISKIIDIEIQIGRTGALTPVAKIDPVNIGGVTVSNATLHNEDEILRKDIRIGDTIKIERAGDVIPHIVSVDLKKRNLNHEKFSFPQTCPSCGSSTIKEFNTITKKKDAVRRCSSEGYECEKVAIEKIKHFVSKDAMNIEGFGKKIVENFWKLKLIRLPQDIFKLNFDKISKLDGWGNQSVKNLKYSIQLRRNITLDKLIYALGIRHIGLENAKLISKNLKNFKSFLLLSRKENFEDLLMIDGIGDTQINSIKSFFNNSTNLKVINELDKLLKIKEIDKIKKDGVFANKTFLFTGKLSNMSRAEAKSLVEKNSGSVISGVSKKLNYLIVGEKPTKRKVDLARSFNVKILDQSKWLKILDNAS